MYSTFTDKSVPAMMLTGELSVRKQITLHRIHSSVRQVSSIIGGLSVQYT